MAPVPPPPPYPGAVGPDQVLISRQAEDLAWPWARWAVWVYAAVAIGQNVALLAATGPFRHQLHQLLSEMEHNQPTQNTLNQLSFPAWLNLLSLLSVAAGIPFLLWQYQAARTARFRGYQARISPGLGIGGWFIPVVNLWFPYWALRDCLPPSHRLRPLGIWAWLSYVAAGLLTVVTFVISYFSAGWAVVPLVVGAGAWVTAATLGSRLMQAIKDDHQETPARDVLGQMAG